MPPSKSKLKVATKRRSLQPSAPEVKLGYAVAGRETMAAIEAELAAPSMSTAEAPLIEISETPAGRETLAAIAEELASEMRPQQNTLPYADRIPNAPGARLPSRMPAAPTAKKASLVPAPERETPSAAPLAKSDGVEIFELLTFIVRGSMVGDLSTDGMRRRFVEQNLLHRIPGGAIEAVERIEVTPWTAKGTMVVRLWCKA